jgi:hypothetical protein
MVHEEVEAALDLYFRQCSILVTARDLAMMAATLSNMGCHPLTGKAALDMSCVKDVLSVMFTCGMYDSSGQWAYRVGIPAKSGVAGGVVAVVNRQLGIGTYSPRLDRFGNSVRGIEVCSELAQTSRASRLRLPERRLELPRDCSLEARRTKRRPYGGGAVRRRLADARRHRIDAESVELVRVNRLIRMPFPSLST